MKAGGDRATHDAIRVRGRPVRHGDLPSGLSASLGRDRRAAPV
jgi:hypothetical protein